MDRNETVMDAEFEPFDDELKRIMKGRYQDKSELFTPEAQNQRRNNRLMFTLKIAAFMACMIFFMVWANGAGLMSVGIMIFGVGTCTAVAGYNIAVCVCHNKGWRGA